MKCFFKNATLSTDLGGKGGRFLYNSGTTPHNIPKFSEYLS